MKQKYADSMSNKPLKRVTISKILPERVVATISEKNER